jgi:hypothetical protein
MLADAFPAETPAAFGAETHRFPPFMVPAALIDDRAIHEDG